MTIFDIKDSAARDDGTLAALVAKASRTAFNPTLEENDKRREISLSNACLKYCLTGQPFVPGFERELLFLEFGFAYGRVWQEGYLGGLRGILDNTKCVIFEPLVVCAVYNTFFASGMLEDRLQAVFNSSAMGFQFETAIPFVFPPVLFPNDGQTLLEDHIYFSDYKNVLPEWAKGVWNIGGQAYGVFANFEDENGVNNTVAKWLKKWRDQGWGKAMGRLPPFFFPGKTFGGDVLWLAFHRETHNPMLWNIQSKLAGTFSLRKAMMTLRPELVYQENRETTKPTILDKWIEPRKQFLTEIKDIPVVTVLLAFPANVRLAVPTLTQSGRETRSGQGQTPPLLPTDFVQQVNHQRVGSKFKQDLQMIIDASNMHNSFIS